MPQPLPVNVIQQIQQAAMTYGFDQEDKLILIEWANAAANGDTEAQRMLMDYGIYVPYAPSPPEETLTQYAQRVPEGALRQVSENEWYVLDPTKQKMLRMYYPSQEEKTRAIELGLSIPEPRILDEQNLPKLLQSQLTGAGMTEYEAGSLAQRQAEEARRQTEWRYGQQYGAELENTRNRLQALQEELQRYTQDILPRQVTTGPGGYISGYGPGEYGTAMGITPQMPVQANINPILSAMRQVQFQPGIAP